MSSTFNAQAVTQLQSALKSIATASGLFRSVLMHEPRSSPGNGLSYALWLGPITPIPALGGLADTAGRVVWNGRVYAPFLTDEDKTEAAMMHAVLEMIAAYSGGFTFGSTVFGIDLKGAYGIPLETSGMGYIEHGGTHFRAAEITIPVLIDALWPEAK